PKRVKEILKRLEVVDCEMEPGDVMFFHGNTLHCSGHNRTGSPRTVIHCHYNAVSNAPFWVEGQEHHQYKPIEKLPDSTIKDGNYSSVFEQHHFHPNEEGETGDGGLGIFKKQDWYISLEDDYSGKESPFANMEV
ncbi:MAG: phytanoyl-CoA dioxygenase family protein, partial [Cytophagales bacterium]